MPTRGKQRGGRRAPMSRVSAQMQSLRQSMRQLKGYPVKNVPQDPPPFHELQTIVLKTRSTLTPGNYNLGLLAPAGVQYKIRKITAWAAQNVEDMSIEYLENVEVLTANYPGVLKAMDHAGKMSRAACAIVPPQDDFSQITATGPTSLSNYMRVAAASGTKTIVDIVWEMKVSLPVNNPVPIVV